jgi:hypothetical protein
MSKLWADVHPLFIKCIGKKEQDQIKQHEAPGMEGTYLGPISMNGNIRQHGHYLLRHSDRKVIKVRTIKCYPGVYPLQPDPQLSISGGQGEDEINLNTETETSNSDSSSSKGKAKASSKGKVVLPDKFPDGSMAMTVIGPCVVLKRYKDGDYQVTFPEACEPQEIRSVKFSDLWHSSDWPDWDYDAPSNSSDEQGKRKSQHYEHKTVHRIPKGKATTTKHDNMADIQVDNLYNDEVENKSVRPNTRSRSKIVHNRILARGPSQFMVYDRGKNETKKLPYPF